MTTKEIKKENQEVVAETKTTTCECPETNPNHKKHKMIMAGIVTFFAVAYAILAVGYFVNARDIDRLQHQNVQEFRTELRQDLRKNQNNDQQRFPRFQNGFESQSGEGQIQKNSN